MLVVILVVFSSQILCGCIVVYQKFISPYKGFRCAHATLHEGLSCSEYGKRSIQQHGVIEGVFLLKTRFEECSLAAAEMKRHNISAGGQAVNSVALLEPPQGGKPGESKQILGEPDPVTEPQPPSPLDNGPGENDVGDLPPAAEPSCSESLDSCSETADSCSELADSCEDLGNACGECGKAIESLYVIVLIILAIGVFSGVAASMSNFSQGESVAGDQDEVDGNIDDSASKSDDVNAAVPKGNVEIDYDYHYDDYYQQPEDEDDT